MVKRRRINEALPKYVYRRSYGFIYRPYLGPGIYSKEVNLCPISSPISAVWQCHDQHVNQDRGTLRWLLREYHDSAKFQSLAPRTRVDYEWNRNTLISFKMANGKPFGGAQLVQIRKTAIRQYLDKYPAPISANRQIQYLKAAWSWAEQRFDSVPHNPCKGVTLNASPPRTRYVTQEEFAAFKATTKGYIPLFMELAYLCRARWSEVAKLKTSDVLAEGIQLERGKGSEGEITAWTARLRSAVRSCSEHNFKAPTPLSGGYLIHNKVGRPVPQNAFQSSWQRAMKKWVASGGERFTYHDLKSAGYSDQKVQDAGHKSDKMHKVYSRKLRVVEPAD